MAASLPVHGQAQHGTEKVPLSSAAPRIWSGAVLDTRGCDFCALPLSERAGTQVPDPPTPPLPSLAYLGLRALPLSLYSLPGFNSVSSCRVAPALPVTG